MAKNKGPFENPFFEWLAKQVSPAQLSELYQAFLELDESVSSNAYTHRLLKPLSETKDPDAVEALYKGLGADPLFLHSRQSSLKLSLLLHYARFLHEQNTNIVYDMPADEGTGYDTMIDWLEAEQIPYEDKRKQRNGALLWISLTPMTDSFIQVFKKAGVSFDFNPQKGKWTTSHFSPLPDVIEYPEVLKENRDGFYEWMKEHHMAQFLIAANLGTLRKIHNMLENEGVTCGLYYVQGADRVRARISETKLKEAFVYGDLKERGLWTSALDDYQRYMDSKPRQAFFRKRKADTAEPIEPKDEKADEQTGTAELKQKTATGLKTSAHQDNPESKDSGKTVKPKETLNNSSVTKSPSI